MAAQNIYRIQINIHEKELCIKVVIYKDYTEMHDQQNIKLTACIYLSVWLIVSSEHLNHFAK